MQALRVGLACLVSSWCLVAAGQTVPVAVREGLEDVLYLDGLADPARWGPAECTVTAAADNRKAADRPTLQLHIPVDHHAGEVRYPIGWPRMYAKLKAPEETGWLEYDRFEFLIYTEMSRPKPPNRPLNLQVHCPAKPDTTNLALSEIEIGRWVRVVLPVDRVAKVENVAQLGFNISESDYQDGDVLDFYIGAFRLVRSAVCRLGDWTVLTPVVYQGQAELRVEAAVMGPPAEVAKGLTVVVRREGKAVGEQTLAVRRGRQTLRLPLASLALTPGNHEVVAFDDAAEPELRRTASFRVVESPWTETGAQP